MYSIQWDTKYKKIILNVKKYNMCYIQTKTNLEAQYALVAIVSCHLFDRLDFFGAVNQSSESNNSK